MVAIFNQPVIASAHRGGAPSTPAHGASPPDFGSPGPAVTEWGLQLFRHGGTKGLHPAKEAAKLTPVIPPKDKAMKIATSFVTGRKNAPLVTSLAMFKRSLLSTFMAVTCLAAGTAASHSAAFTGTYTFGTGGNVASFDFNGTPITGLTVSALTKVGITTSSSNNNFRGTNWPLGATNGSDVFSGSVDTGKYIQFTITAEPGMEINLPSISFGIGRSGTGPRQWQWRSSVDGFTAPIPVTTVNAGITYADGVMTVPDTDSNWTGNVIQTAGSAYENLSTITFRLYGYNAEGTGGSGGLQGPLTFGGQLEGVVVPTITAPSTAAPLNAIAGGPSTVVSFEVTGALLVDDITVEAPEDFEVSTDNVVFDVVAVIPEVDGEADGTVYVRIADTAPEGPVGGDILLTSTDANDVDVTVAGVVRPELLELPYGPDNFETTSFPWYSYTVAGTANWIRATAGGNSFMQVNGFGSTGNANAWLILGPFDIPEEAENLIASFTIQKAFTGPDEEFNMQVSTDYDGLGDPSLANWTTVPFTKPATVAPDNNSTVMTPSGAITLPSSLAGESGVYVAFQLAATSTSATSRWRIDDFEMFASDLPVLSVIVVPSTIDEGSAGTGTVTIPAPLEDDIEITITSADPTVLLVNGQASTEVIIPGGFGFTDAGFDVETIRDFEPGPDVPVQVTAEAGEEYEFGQTMVIVRNIDLPYAPLTIGGYEQDFSTFSAPNPPVLPEGWSMAGPIQTFPGTEPGPDNTWGTGTSGGLRGGASVFGYQHTSTTGVFQQILTLRNETGSEITELTVSYRGRVARASEGRSPAYVVTVNDVTASALAYSTTDGDNILLSAGLTGLSIPPNGIITIVWSSDRDESGSGSSKQIGISEVSVTIGADVSAPSVAGLSVPPAGIARITADVQANVTGDGGEEITARGFVFAETSVNPTPTLGGTGVTTVTDPDTDLGEMFATLTGLDPATNYSVRAYATNSVGTSYTGTQTFTTLDPGLAFTGAYFQPFNNYTGTVPEGWNALSSGGVNAYAGNWGAGTAGGFRGNVADPGVIGYQHTGTSGVLTVTLAMVNDTGSTINELNVSYLGRVARIDQTRHPEWTVTVNGEPVPALTYSTGNTDGPEGEAIDLTVATQLEGLNIADGEEIVIVWSSERGGTAGSSRQIGLANVFVSTGAQPEIDVVGSLVPFATTLGEPSVPQTFSVSGDDLAGDITITAPEGFEVSADGISYEPSVTLIPSGGTVGTTTIYVWLTGEELGSPAGLINVSSPGAADVNIAVSGTVTDDPLPPDTGFNEWSGGMDITSALLVKYAVGGASSPSAESVPPVTEVEDDELSVTVIVRTDDPYLDVTGEAIDNLLTGEWSEEGVTFRGAGDGVNQDGVPAGCERRIYSVDIAGNKTFLRLVVVLAEE